VAQGCSSTSTHKLKGMGLRELFGAAAGTALVNTGDVHGARSAHNAFSFFVLRTFPFCFTRPVLFP
jgi:hypothetical protein